MSYDIWAEGPLETHVIGNMTSNVAPMWRKASPITDGLAGIDGQEGELIAAELSLGLDYMFRHRRDLEKLNPPNGWGNFGHAFRYFAAVTRTAIDFPDATFRVSK